MATELIDGYGRVHRDLRISVTDRCNFRCTYCMPEEGMEWLDRSAILSFEEIERIARILVERYDFESIRLTGGEPTIRAHLPLLIEKLAALGIEVALTTNASALTTMAQDLVDAGLSRINISLDTLKPERFVALTKRDRFDEVMQGISAAQAVGLDPVKINAVVMRGINDDEIVEFAHWGRDNGLVIRFIEFMPLDAQGEWTNDTVVTYDEIFSQISTRWELEPLVRGSSPADRFRYVDGGGEIGIVASVTQNFCHACDRVRLTAEGQLRNCLFSMDDWDLRATVRSGGTDDDIARIIEEAVGAKWEGHRINQVHFIRPSKSMSQIGG
ncbi:MAG: GTP 3',8-cyclase MoaA [Actinomycetia bacterium]|nr:GTP 3',8-cyclase MoaA [Actinomycetes bacterium]